jgi:peptidoglycan/LPS O-acetylase OafA/YrhL
MSTLHAPVAFKKTSASVLLDLVRGLAACMVLLEHWRNLFFDDYSTLPHHNLFLLAGYLFTGAGHQAVVVFFLLSGYLIGGSVFRTLARQTWSWKDYLLHRFTRLWIVLIPGLLLGGLWDWIGMHHAHAALLYSGQVPNHMLPDIHTTLTAKTLLGNAAFLQTIYVPTFGSNGALWSLANEFWYYMLFPLGLLTLWKSTRIIPRLFYLILFLLLAAGPCRSLVSGFPLWLAGVLLTFMPVLRMPHIVRVTTGLLYALLFIGFIHQPYLAGITGDYVFAGITFLFFWIMLSATGEAKENTFARFSRTLSSFSYTLYVVHTPLVLLCAAFLVGDGRLEPTLPHLALTSCILLAVVAYAWALALCTEVHTHRVVAWFGGKSR